MQVKINFTELRPSWDRNSRSADQGNEPDASLQCSQQSTPCRVLIHTSPVPTLTLHFIECTYQQCTPIHAYVSQDNFSLRFYV